MEPDVLVVTGAREHNLKGITVRVPKNRLVVFTGVSGSGKSSLAFDTLYAEGQRRYVESLSAYARQFLGRLERPRYETIRGLAPTIAIEQRTSSSNPRSTVATITEIADYLRVLYARAGEPHCPKCGRTVEPQSAETIVGRLLAHPEGTTLTLLAPLVDARKGEHKDELEEAKKSGFTRVRIDGDTVRLDALPALAPKVKHTIEIVIDRIVLKDGVRPRLTDSVEMALRAGSGRLVVVTGTDAAASEETMSESSACPVHGISIPELTPQLFSWNAPHGMCRACQGLGTRLEVDEALLVPDPTLSIDEGAIALFRGAGVVAGLQKMVLDAVVKEFRIDRAVPFRKLPAAQRAVLLDGKPERDLKVRLKSTRMDAGWTTQWIGLKPLVEKKFRDTMSEDMRHFYMRFFSATPCDACGGTRLNEIARAVEVGGKSLPALLALGVGDALAFFERLKLPGARAVIAQDLVREVRGRLKFLVDVGLPYLTLDRGGASLSGGEAQRIRLASQVGSELTGVLYVLDEPSIGLHARDTMRLVATLLRLRDLGNTVLVVEHDADTIRAADHVVDFGPAAGVHGGEVMAEGTPDEVAACERSLTGAYLSGREAIPLPARRREAKGELVLRGATLHNLVGDDVTLPLSTLIAVTGVSGAGKSSLVTGTLEPLLAEKLMGATRKPGPFRAIEGLDLLDKMVAIDQRAIGLTPRSNPATYVKAFDEIRTLFASLKEAKTYGFAPGRFSFNVKGGRCEACEGDGVSRVEMHFLPDVYVTCEVCGGKRFNEATLRVRFKGKSIADVLELTVAESLDLFADVPRVARPLRTLDAVGLGYVRIGQPSTTLSGGEAQRVKLSRELARTDTGKTFYILDEPTTGLHFEDVRRLLLVLDRLVEQGNTVLVIEHNLEVVKCADWVIDVGPEGGAGGGRVVAAGTPEAVAKVKASHTGRFLGALLR